jgi:hypothetical protein
MLEDGRTLNLAPPSPLVKEPTMTVLARTHYLTAAAYLADARIAKANGRPAVVAHYVRQARYFGRVARGTAPAPMPFYEA